MKKIITGLMAVSMLVMLTGTAMADFPYGYPAGIGTDHEHITAGIQVSVDPYCGISFLGDTTVTGSNFTANLPVLALNQLTGNVASSSINFKASANFDWTLDAVVTSPVGLAGKGGFTTAFTNKTGSAYEDALPGLIVPATSEADIAANAAALLALQPTMNNLAVTFTATSVVKSGSYPGGRVVINITKKP